MTRLMTMSALALCLVGVSACDLIARDGPSDEAPDVVVDTQLDEIADVNAVEAEVDPSPAEQIPVRPTAAEATAEIDWAAARSDLASVPNDQREGAFQVASGGEAPPVPVLLPSGIVVPAGAESQVRFQPLKDGYFASYPGAAYDIIVNGTNEVIGNADRDDERVENMRFQPTASGAQVSLSRYGADYLVEFECNDADGGEVDCISEEEALDVSRRLVIAGTR